MQSGLWYELLPKLMQMLSIIEHNSEKSLAIQQNFRQLLRGKGTAGTFCMGLVLFA